MNMPRKTATALFRMATYYFAEFLYRINYKYMICKDTKVISDKKHVDNITH